MKVYKLHYRDHNAGDNHCEWFSSYEDAYKRYRSLFRLDQEIWVNSGDEYEGVTFFDKGPKQEHIPTQKGDLLEWLNAKQSASRYDRGYQDGYNQARKVYKECEYTMDKLVTKWNEYSGTITVEQSRLEGLIKIMDGLEKGEPHVVSIKKIREIVEDNLLIQ